MHSSGALFLVAFLLFVDGIAAQGKEFRKINVFVLTDAGDDVANHSFATSFKHLKSDNEARVGQVYYAQINGSDPKRSLENVCTVWDSAVGNDTEGPPDVILDATSYGPTSEIAEYFATQLRVPMLSAHYERSGHLLGWRDISEMKQDYLARLTNPAEVLPRVVMKHCKHFNIESAAIFYDSTLGPGVWRNDLPAWFRLMEATEPLAEKISTLASHKVLNFFVMGREETIDRVMSVATKLNLTSNSEFKWHAITLADDYMPNCVGCDSATFMLFQPHLPAKQRLINVLASQGDLSRPFIMSAFYYDMAKMGTEATRIAVDLEMLPNSRYGQCGSYNKSARVTFDRPALNFQLYESRNLYESTYASFIWDDNKECAVKFDVKASLVQIRNSRIVSKDLVETWQAGSDSPISIHNTWMAQQHQAKVKYRILTKQKPPFVEFKDGEWSGYCIELLNEIRKHMTFEYELTEVKDGKYGYSDDEGNWDGMVRELKDKRVDIALGALEVMAERDVVMDFTTPIYEDSGFTIVRKRPKTKQEIFKFFTVLGLEVWLCILSAHLFTSVLMWIFDRLSPYSYRNNKSAYTRAFDRRLFTLKECVWFCTMSLTPQGGGETPKNLSGRLIAATWWIFGFIINASYTANLIANNSMDKDNREKPPESLDDFSNQYKIQYAPIENSSAYYYFLRMSDVEKQYYEIWKRMSLNDSLSLVEQAKLAVWDYPVSDRFTKMFQTMQDSRFPRDMDDALSRVLSDSPIEFALIGDANDIRYKTLFDCDLMQVGDEFSKRPYAIGVQQGSPLKEHLNHVLHLISKERKLEALKREIWDNIPDQQVCLNYDEAIDGIGWNSIGGLFILSFSGIGLAFGVIIFEFFYYRYWTKSKPFRKIRAIEDKSLQKIKSIAFYWPALMQALNIND